MVRTGLLVLAIATMALMGCDGEGKKSFVLGHLFFVSGEELLHPSHTLVEFSPVMDKQNNVTHFSFGPLRQLSHCGGVRCGVYEPALSAHIYPVLPFDVLEVSGDKAKVFSVEVEHQMGDTIVLEFSFSGVVEGDSIWETVDGTIRVPVVKSHGNIYRCIVDEQTVTSRDDGWSVKQHFFVNLNSLFM